MVMMFGALKDAPQVKCLMFSFTKGHQPLLQGQNYFKKENCGIHPRYVDNWSVVKGAIIELHKFWFRHDNQNCYVKGI
jgi:hypothetical protein